MSVSQRHRPRESKLTANKHRILNRIFREGRCSRFYLARRLNINASTIGNYVDDFLQQGILLEDHVRPTRRGRSPVPVWLNPDYGRFLGVDFEALRVRTVLTDFAGGIVAQKEVGLCAGLGREAVLKIVLDAAKETARQADTCRLFAVGIASPGLLDSVRGRICATPSCPTSRMCRCSMISGRNSTARFLLMRTFVRSRWPRCSVGPAGDIGTSCAWPPDRASAWGS